MRRFLKVFFVSILIMLSNNVYSQIVLEPDPYLQKARIGLVDEFIKRFNGQILHPNISAKANDSRKKNLQMLFNLAQYKSIDDPAFEKATTMIEKAIDDSIVLSYNDKKWAAIAHCKGTIDGKNVSFDIYLVIQQRKEDMYKWVISKVEGKCFETSPRDTSEKIMLSPDDHETNFISLARMTKEQPFNVRLFMSKEYMYDATSAFVYLVHTKKMKISHVENLEFIFTQIPEYAFHIQYYERESGNSGWLISKFYPYSDIQKKELLNSLCLQTNESQINFSYSFTKEALGKNEISIAEMCKWRLNEQIALMKDYLSYIKDKSHLKEQRTYYQIKFQNLFVPNANVVITDSLKSITKTLKLNDFTSDLLQNTYGKIDIDSICVPLCIDSLSNVEENTVQIDLPSVLIDLRNESQIRTISESDKILFVRKEFTEDGYEWMPMFGDVYITVK